MFAPLLVYQVSVTRRENRTGKEWSLSIGKEPQVLHNSLIVPLFFLLYLVLLICRHESIGRDLSTYRYFFEMYATQSLPRLYEIDGDILYYLLNWLVGRFTRDYQVFMAIVAIITVLPIAKIYSEDKQYGFLKIVLFMNMSVFTMVFSGLRQSLAIAMGLVAFEFVRKKKPFFFLLFALIALGFHHTGFMILLYYPLYHMRLNKNRLWMVIPVITAVFVFNKQIFGWATNLLFMVMGDKYNAEIQETGAYMMVILFALFAVAAYFFPDEEKMDDEARGLRNFLLMAVLLQCFAPVHSLAMRMNYYYIVFVPISVPKIFKHAKGGLKDIVKITKGVVVGFFVVYYLYTTFQSCRSGISALNTYPYVPFWEY
jgi:hypothetical protein